MFVCVRLATWQLCTPSLLLNILGWALGPCDPEQDKQFTEWRDRMGNYSNVELPAIKFCEHAAHGYKHHWNLQQFMKGSY